MTAAVQAVNAQSAREICVEPVSFLRIRYDTVPLQLLNILPQVRDDMEEESLRVLANTIVTDGLMQPPRASELTSEALTDYLAKHGRQHGVVLQRSKLAMDFTTRLYYVVTFGHRRIMAHHYLWNVGCDTCVEQFGPEAPGTCWARHPDVLSPDGVMTQIVRAQTWDQAIRAQHIENTYEPVSRENEARSWRGTWEVLREANPKLTIKEFARGVGRSAAVVSEALRFCDLPEETKKMVAKGHIAWGIALELLRMHAAGCPESAIIYRTHYAMVHRPTVSRFRQIITGVLEEHSAAQDDMFQLSVEEIQTVRTTKLAGDLEGVALRTLAAEHRDLLARLAALKDGDLAGYEQALTTPAVQRALALAEQVHEGLGSTVPPVSKRRRTPAAG